jgi:hypothetical protein
MKGIISNIININLDDEYAYEKLLDIFLKTRPFPVYTIPIEKEKNFIYRTRENDKRDFIDFSELSNPPIKNVTNFGRANKPFQSVFYGSDSWKTNITELMPNWFLDKNTGDKITITITKWKVVENLNVIIIPDFKNEKMSEIIKRIKTLEILDEELMFLSFINQIFNENTFYNKRIYKITSAFCNALIIYFSSLGMKIDGVLYTSAQDNNGWNLALESHVVENKMIVLDRAMKQVIEKMNSIPVYNNFQEPEFAKRIDFKNKKILW